MNAAVNAGVNTRWSKRARRALRPRRGLNILDSLWGVALIGVGALLVVGGGYEAWQWWKEFRGGYLQSRMVQVTAATFRSTRNYGTGSLLVTLDKFKRLPEAFVIRNGAGVIQRVEHPWGGTVAVTGSPPAATNQFRIQFNALDADVCAGMAELTAAKTRSKSGLAQVLVNSTALAMPYTVATAAVACNAGDGANSVAWDYF